MANCKRCGTDLPANEQRRICIECMGNWRTMKSISYQHCEQTIGEMKGENFNPFQQEMKRLERIWKKDKVKWETIVGALVVPEI